MRSIALLLASASSVSGAPGPYNTNMASFYVYSYSHNVPNAFTPPTITYGSTTTHTGLGVANIFGSDTSKASWDEQAATQAGFAVKKLFGPDTSMASYNEKASAFMTTTAPPLFTTGVKVNKRFGPDTSMASFDGEHYTFVTIFLAARQDNNGDNVGGTTTCVDCNAGAPACKDCNNGGKFKRDPTSGHPNPYDPADTSKDGLTRTEVATRVTKRGADYAGQAYATSTGTSEINGETSNIYGGGGVSEHEGITAKRNVGAEGSDHLSVTNSPHSGSTLKPDDYARDSVQKRHTTASSTGPAATGTVAASFSIIPVTGQKKVIDEINAFRLRKGLKAFNWLANLAYNAYLTGQHDKSVGKEDHDLQPASNAEVITEGITDDTTCGRDLGGHTPFGLALLSWLCEVPSDPAIGANCKDATNIGHYSFPSGETGHYDIIVNPDYANAGCWYTSDGTAPCDSSWSGYWVCEFN